MPRTKSPKPGPIQRQVDAGVNRGKFRPEDLVPTLS